MGKNSRLPFRGMQARMLKDLLARRGVTKAGQKVSVLLAVGTVRVKNAVEVHFCSALATDETSERTRRRRELAYDWDLKIRLRGFPAMPMNAPGILVAPVCFHVSESGQTVTVVATGPVSFLAASRSEDFTVPGSIEEYLAQRYRAEFDAGASVRSVQTIAEKYGMSSARSPQRAAKRVRLDALRHVEAA